MIEYVFGTIFILIGIFCLVVKRNLIKKIMGLGIITAGIHLLLITVGYRKNSIPPIITPENLLTFSQYSVDPLPQALVLTSIVIGLGTLALMAAFAIRLYEKYRTFDMSEIHRLRG